MNRRRRFMGRSTFPGPVYRHGYPWALWRGGSLAGVALAIFLSVVPPLSPWQLLYVPAFLGMAAFLWRLSGVGVYLGKEGVKLRRSFRTVIIPWSSFRRFVLRPRLGCPKAGHVELMDGSLVWAEGLGPFWRFGWFDRGGVDRVVRELNARSAEMKA